MQRRKTGSRIAALFLSVFMLIAYMPLLGGAVYADDVTTSLTLDATSYEYANWGTPSFKVTASSTGKDAWVGIYEGTRTKTFDWTSTQANIYAYLDANSKHGSLQGVEFDIMSTYDDYAFQDSSYWVFPAGDYTAALFHDDGTTAYACDEVFHFTITDGTAYDLSIIADEDFGENPRVQWGTSFRYALNDQNLKMKITVPSGQVDTAWVGIAQFSAGSWNDYSGGYATITSAMNGQEYDYTSAFSSLPTGYYRVALYSSGYYPETFKYIYYREDKSGATVHLSETEFTYNGAIQKPTVTSVEGVNAAYYTTAFPDSADAGEYTATVTFKGAYFGSSTADYKILPADTSALTVSEIADQNYTGNEIKPDVEVKIGNNVLPADDYVVTYSNNVNVSDSATATITPKENGNLTGDPVTATFNIVCGEIGHDYGEPTYTWAEDGSKCTAKAICKNDSAHELVEEGTITSEVKTKADCETKGTTTYTATFNNAKFGTQTKEIDDIAALGHTWVDANCTEPKTCSVCGAKEGEALGHNLTKTEAKEATTEAEGNIEYWTCSVCKKYFSDAEGKTEITQDETVIPKKDEQKPDGPTDAEKAIAAAKEALNKLIEKAKEYVKAKYTEETFKVLQDAVAEAEVLVKDSKATAEELNEAASKLSDAMENLKEIEESIPDTDTAVAAAKEALNKAVENAKKVAKDKYTEASYKALEDAIAEAEALAESGKATAEQLKAAGAKIADAINGLKEKEEATPGQTDEEKAAAAAKEDLNKAVTDAKAIEQGVYTDESYKALQDAIAEAEALEADPKATAEQLKAAAAKIEEAKNGLAVIADAAEEYGKDGTAVGPGASAEAADAAIKSLPNDNDPAGAKFAPLKLRSSKQGKTYITLNWTKSKKAVKYVIYGNACGKANKFKKLKTVKGSSSKITKITKKLKKAKSYKFLVVALDSNNKVVSTSKVIHVCTKGKANYTKVTTKAKNNKVSLKKGKTFKLGAKAVGKNVKKHVGIRYESSNKKVATVNKSGKITAKKKGTCKIYAYAQNGVRKIIKVTVK